MLLLEKKIVKLAVAGKGFSTREIDKHGSSFSIITISCISQQINWSLISKYLQNCYASKPDPMHNFRILVVLIELPEQSRDECVPVTTVRPSKFVW